MGEPQYVVAVVGGATAGAEAAAMLAERGVAVVVFEQNARPDGKIEDGLPRWHAKLRRKEYELIDAKLSHPGIAFVPCTKIGRDVTLPELVRDWGFSAVVLAHGAWRDRPLELEGAERYVGKGLVYQNPFISWFNHRHERGYAGPRMEVADGALVIGGGLASIDVVKVLQIETVRAALAARGIVVDPLHAEQKGIPGVLAAHGLDWGDLGLVGATLVYRRRIEDMPLAEMPEEADAAQREKVEATRRRIVEKAMQKFRFRVLPLRVPVGLLVEGDRVVGLRIQATRVEAGRAVPVAGAVEEVRAPLVISSIGSVPEPMPGVHQEGQAYRWDDPAIGRLAGWDTVFGSGNVVIGKGNILASRRHSAQVTEHLIQQFLGLGDGGHDGEEGLLESRGEAVARLAGSVLETMRARPAPGPDGVAALMERVRARQRAVGYDGDYAAWLARVTPPDFA